MIVLDTSTTKHGVRLRHRDGRDAGMLEAVSVELNGIRWRFVPPSIPNTGTRGAKRVSLKAAEYDALAYWEEEAAQ